MTASAAAAAAQDFAAARAHGEEALRIGHATRNPSILALANWSLGQALAATDPDAALDRFEESLGFIRSGSSQDALTPTLVELGRLKARAGDGAGAIAALQEAIMHAYDMGNRVFFVGALVPCICAFASFAIDEPAAVLEGVVSEGPLADTQHYYDFMAPQRQAALEAVRDRLGDDTYSNAVRYGSKLSYERVVEYVSQLFADLTAQPPVSNANRREAAG